MVRGGGGVIKTVNEEGGGCVNTQTGSVGLISSQSNIVYGENEDSLANKCEAVPQPCVKDISTLKNVNSVKPACGYANKECDKFSMKNVSGIQPVCDIDIEAYDEYKIESVSGVQPEGKIEKKVNISSKPPIQRLKKSLNPSSKPTSSSISNSHSTQRLREYFTALSSSGGNVGRGVNLTPVKRKLLIDKQVPNLVKAYNCHVHETESSESEQMCSPAKRPKLDIRGQTPQQPAANINQM